MKMKKMKLSSIFAVGLFLLCALFSANTVIAQDDGGPCQSTVFSGTQVFFPGGDPQFDWECEGEFTNCTEVYITCAQ